MFAIHDLTGQFNWHFCYLNKTLIVTLERIYHLENNNHINVLISIFYSYSNIHHQRHPIV